MTVERKIFRTSVLKRAIDETARSIKFVVSSATKDRDGDVVEPGGWEISDYLKNPIVLWAHDSRQPPIAMAESVQIGADALTATAKFTTVEENPFGDMVFRLYKGGFLNAVSAGFNPIDYAARYGEGDRYEGMHFKKQSLHEFSAVPVPSNPDALIAAKATKGIDLNPLKSWCEKALDTDETSVPREMIGAAYKALGGTSIHVSSTRQAALLAKNLETLRAREKNPNGDFASTEGEHDEQTPVNTDTDQIKGDEELSAWTLSTSGEPAHAHDLEPGASQTTAGGEDDHVHAVSYTDEGVPVIEEAEGHTHEAPSDARVDVAEEDAADEEEAKAAEDEDEAAEEETKEGDEDEAAEEGDDEEKSLDLEEWELGTPDPDGAVQKTNFPELGQNKSVELESSTYDRFPTNEARALRKHFPDLWAMGDRFDFDGLVMGAETAVRRREKWAASNVDRGGVVAVMSCVKHLVVHAKGLSFMRRTIAEAKELIEESAAYEEEMRPEVKEHSSKDEIEIDAKTVVELTAKAVQEQLANIRGRVS